MLNLVRGFWLHGRDRGFVLATAIRCALCATVAFTPFLVGLPTQNHLVSIAYFLPTIYGVLGAVTLREHTQWLRPRNPLLGASRGTITVLGDVICLAPFITALDGQPEQQGIVAGALLTMTASMAVACLAQELAWLGGAFVGFACLLAFGGHALIFYLPLNASLFSYGVALILHSVRGPRQSP